MKRFVLLAIAIVAMVSGGCSTTWQSASIGDDIYAPHDRTEIAQRKRAIAEAERAEAEARTAAWEAKLAEARAEAAEAQYHSVAAGDSYQSVVASTYESAYARRLYGFSSPTYRMPSSYYSLLYSDAYFYASAYDPAFYNVMVAGDQVWVEPKYITSMFGSWGAVALRPYGWYYGWSRPYYSAWWYGYPSYSWYGWGVYDPFWGYPFYGGYYPPHGHRPPFVGGGHIHHNRPTIVSRPNSNTVLGRPSNVAGGVSRPASGSGGSVIRPIRGTVTGSGEYRGSSGSTVRPRNSGTRAAESFNRRSETNSMGGSYGGYSGGYSGGGNSSGGSHGGGQHRR